MSWPAPGHPLRRTMITLLICGAAALSGAPARAAAPTTHIVQLRADVTLGDGAALVRSVGGRVTGRLEIIHGLAIRLPRGGRERLSRDPRVATLSSNARVRPKDVGTDESAPAGTDPLPAEPDPTLTEPDPTLTEPDPTLTEPDPTLTEPDPTLTEPDPTLTEPDPTLTEPDPTLTEPDPPAAETGWAFDRYRLATAYPFAVRAPRAWSLATGAGVGVAVIDTGIDGSLPDFKAADGSSRVTASVITDPSATTAADTYGHGTHVAGIIAGDGGRRDPADPLAGRYVGIAPRAHLISIKAGDDEGRATVLDVIYGLQFAVEHKDDYAIRVVNLSLESTLAQSYRTDPLDAAVESAYFHGLVVVAAAGNHGQTADAANYAPGNDPFALTVGAIDDQGTRWRGDDAYTEWSSVGLTQDGFAKPEIAAPGAHIVSALAPGSAFASLCAACVVDGEYIRAGGTSMAAPVVSGVAALMLERHPEWTPDEVKSTIVATGHDLYGGVDEVNAGDAVAVDVPAAGADAGIVPNDLVDAAGGDIDYSRSSWSRSSWSVSPDQPVAGWARSSWSCTCPTSEGDAVDPTRSSWSRSSWSTRWSY